MVEGDAEVTDMATKEGKLVVLRRSLNDRWPSDTLSQDGKRYYLWRSTFTVKGSRRHVKRAIEAGYDVLLARPQEGTLGTLLYTHPEHK